MLQGSRSSFSFNDKKQVVILSLCAQFMDSPTSHNRSCGELNGTKTIKLKFENYDNRVA